MKNLRVRNRGIAIAATTGIGVLVLAGCSSNSSTSTVTVTEKGGDTKTETATAAPATRGDKVPAPPSGATSVVGPEDDKGAVYERYKTSQTPADVVTYYKDALSKAGFTITSSGTGGGGWGQYGGSGGGVSGNGGGTFVEVNAGGSKEGSTYFEVCSGASQAVVQACQGNQHGQSKQS
ncbi:MAG: hypothetical protein WCP26_12170 [Actinomycetes bacterium]